MEEIQNFPPCGGLFSGCFSFCLCTENSVSLLCSTHFTGLAILMLKNSLQIIFEAFFPGFYNSIHFSEQSWVAIEAKIVRSGNTVKNKGLIIKGVWGTCIGHPKAPKVLLGKNQVFLDLS